MPQGESERLVSMGEEDLAVDIATVGAISVKQDHQQIADHKPIVKGGIRDFV